jgi:hypothetical protein
MYAIRRDGWAQRGGIDRLIILETCDYLAYAFLPSARCYVLPFQQLQLYWQKYRREWMQRYGPPIEAQNEGYVSVGVAVPITVLLSALTNMLMVSWMEQGNGALLT